MKFSPEERFWSHVKIGPDCWTWNAVINNKGYGYFGIKINGEWKKIYAHRFSYQISKGDIPPGKEIDHLCRNRRCVNPAHLEAVTRRINVLRGENHTAKFAIATHCKRGHIFDEVNTRRRKDSTSRICIACVNYRNSLRKVRP